MKDVRPVVYHSIEEKRQAFMRAVNMRKEWEARMRKKIAEMDAAKAASFSS